MQMPVEDSVHSNMSKKRPNGLASKMAPMPNTIQNLSEMGDGTFENLMN